MMSSELTREQVEQRFLALSKVAPDSPNAFLVRCELKDHDAALRTRVEEQGHEIVMLKEHLLKHLENKYNDLLKQNYTLTDSAR